MKNPSTLTLALTWDGARAPMSSVPPAARTFLRSKTSLRPPSAKSAAQLFISDSIREIRIAWLPHLRGGENVLSLPCELPNHLRLNFRLTKSRVFGDTLAAIYRRP